MTSPRSPGTNSNSGMLVAVAGLPAQIRDAWARSRSLDLPGRHSQAKAVAVLGMGGSAIAGDLVAGTFADRLTLPVAVVRGYELPAWVGPNALVVASSYSGATEETLAAVETAFMRRCPVAVITTGGPLGTVAEKASLPLLAFPGGGQPRAAVGWSTICSRACWNAQAPCRSPTPRSRRGPLPRTPPSPRGGRRFPPRRTSPSSSPGPCWTGCRSSRAPGPLRPSHGAGRRSSTRTPRRWPSGMSCPRPTTTPSWAIRSPSRPPTTSCICSWHPPPTIRATPCARSWPSSC